MADVLLPYNVRLTEQSETLPMGLITTKKAAQILGVKPRRVQRLVAEYEDMRELLKAEKPGRDWLLDESAVREYAKNPRKRGRPVS